MLWPKGSPFIIIIRLMLRCEEKNLGRVLPPTNKATERLFYLNTFPPLDIIVDVIVYMNLKVPS